MLYVTTRSESRSLRSEEKPWALGQREEASCRRQTHKELYLQYLLGHIQGRDQSTADLPPESGQKVVHCGGGGGRQDRRSVRDSLP
jgi:hypothetical protein